MGGSTIGISTQMLEAITRPDISEESQKRKYDRGVHVVFESILDLSSFRFGWHRIVMHRQMKILVHGPPSSSDWYEQRGADTIE